MEKLKHLWCYKCTGVGIVLATELENGLIESAILNAADCDFDAYERELNKFAKEHNRPIPVMLLIDQRVCIDFLNREKENEELIKVLLKKIRRDYRSFIQEEIIENKRKKMSGGRARKPDFKTESIWGKLIRDETGKVVDYEPFDIEKMDWLEISVAEDGGFEEIDKIIAEFMEEFEEEGIEEVAWILIDFKYEMIAWDNFKGEKGVNEKGMKKYFGKRFGLK